MAFDLKLKNISSEKFDLKSFKKFLGTKGYKILDFHFEFDKNTHKPNGKAMIQMRNNRKNPDHFEWVVNHLKS